MSFKIGHFAVLQNAAPYAQYEGQRVEILTDLAPRIVMDEDGVERMVMGHEILLADGNHLVVMQAALKSIVGARESDKVVSWQSCAWRPIPGMVKRLESLTQATRQAELAQAAHPTQADRLTVLSWLSAPWSPYQKIDCMLLARELYQVRQRSAELRRRLS